MRSTSSWFAACWSVVLTRAQIAAFIARPFVLPYELEFSLVHALRQLRAMAKPQVATVRIDRTRPVQEG